MRNAGVQTGEQVLEIGPGLGSLTLALLEAGAVSAVEIGSAPGPSFADYRPGSLPGSNYKLYC